MKDIALKVGTYQEVGATGKVSGLRLSQAILDILVFKGILETVDCINYTLPVSNSVTDVQLTYAPSNSELSINIDGVTDSVIIEPLTNHVNTSAAITIGATVYPIGTELQTILTALNAALSSGFMTDLSIINRGIDTLDINSSTGAGTTVPAATNLLSGLMTAQDKDELERLRVLSGTGVGDDNLGTFVESIIPDGSDVKEALQSLETAISSASSTNLSMSNHNINTLDVNSSNGSDITLPAATTSLSGLMTGGDKAESASIRTLTGTAAGANDLGTFTESIIPDNVTIKVALQSIETVVATHKVVQEDTAAEFRGINIDTATAGIAKVGVDIHNQPIDNSPTSTGETLVYDSGTAGNYRVTLGNFTKGLTPMAGSTTTTAGQQGVVPTPPIDSQNKFLRGDGAFGTSIPLWVNTEFWEVGDIVRFNDLIYRVVTAHTGGAFSSGNFVELSAGGGGSGTTLGRTIENGGDVKYFVMSGTPVVTFTKSGGIGTVGVSGGTIELSRVQVNLTSSDLSSNTFKLIAPAVNTTMFQYPDVTKINRQLGGNPDGTLKHTYDIDNNPQVSAVGGTAGTSIEVEVININNMNTTCTLLYMF